MQTEFGIQHRLENCAPVRTIFYQFLFYLQLVTLSQFSNFSLLSNFSKLSNFSPQRLQLKARVRSFLPSPVSLAAGHILSPLSNFNQFQQTQKLQLFLLFLLAVRSNVQTWNLIIGLYPYLVQFTETSSPQISASVKDALLEYHDLLKPYDTT